MSMLLIRQALELALKTINDAHTPIDTAYENDSYDPVAGRAFQVVSLLPAAPENPTVGAGGPTRERGIFQVLLRFPQGSGAKLSAERAELYKTVFTQGASFAQGGVTVICSGTPQVAPAFIDGDRYCVPIRVPWFSNLSP